jgi:hypothetical protein
MLVPGINLHGPPTWRVGDRRTPWSPFVVNGLASRMGRDRRMFGEALMRQFQLSPYSWVCVTPSGQVIEQPYQAVDE